MFSICKYELCAKLNRISSELVVFADGTPRRENVLAHQRGSLPATFLKGVDLSSEISVVDLFRVFERPTAVSL